MSFELISGDGDTTKRPRPWGDQQDRVDLIRDLTDEIADCNSALRDSLHIPQEIDYEQAATIASQIYEKAKDWYLESTLEGHNNYNNGESVAFSPDGKRIVSGGRDTKIRILNAGTGQLERVLEGHSRDGTGERVRSVAFSPDGGRIVSGGSDATIRIWNAETGQIERVLQFHTNRVNSVAFSPDGKRIVSGGLGGRILIWNADTGEVVRTVRAANSNSGVNSVAFSPDGGRMVSGVSVPSHVGSPDASIRIWNAETGEVVHTLRGHSFSVTSVAFSPDGKRIVSGGNDATIRIWNADTGEVVRTIQVRQKVSSVVFSPDGKHIVSGSEYPGGMNYADNMRKTMQIWNAETGNFVRWLEGHKGYVTSVAFSPDGERIVSQCVYGEIKIWKFDVRLT